MLLGVMSYLNKSSELSKILKLFRLTCNLSWRFHFKMCSVALFKLAHYGQMFAHNELEHSFILKGTQFGVEEITFLHVVLIAAYLVYSIYTLILSCQL